MTHPSILQNAELTRMQPIAVMQVMVEGMLLENMLRNRFFGQLSTFLRLDTTNPVSDVNLDKGKYAQTYIGSTPAEAGNYQFRTGDTPGIKDASIPQHTIILPSYQFSTKADKMVSESIDGLMKTYHQYGYSDAVYKSAVNDGLKLIVKEQSELVNQFVTYKMQEALFMQEYEYKPTEDGNTNAEKFKMRFVYKNKTEYVPNVLLKDIQSVLDFVSDLEEKRFYVSNGSENEIYGAILAPKKLFRNIWDTMMSSTDYNSNEVLESQKYWKEKFKIERTSVFKIPGAPILILKAHEETEGFLVDDQANPTTFVPKFISRDALFKPQTQPYDAKLRKEGSMRLSDAFGGNTNYIEQMARYIPINPVVDSPVTFTNFNTLPINNANFESGQPILVGTGVRFAMPINNFNNSICNIPLDPSIYSSQQELKDKAVLAVDMLNAIRRSIGELPITPTVLRNL
tara:strand:- start:1151 stop:2518 length:1368 start_codon:yes stop_codon:yes gene_type:complete